MEEDSVFEDEKTEGAWNYLWSGKILKKISGWLFMGKRFLCLR